MVRRNVSALEAATSRFLVFKGGTALSNKIDVILAQKIARGELRDKFRDVAGMSPADPEARDKAGELLGAVRSFNVSVDEAIEIIRKLRTDPEASEMLPRPGRRHIA
jgi:hypothetical protein